MQKKVLQTPFPQSPITSSYDLRDMVRRYLIARSLGCMHEAANRRREVLQSGNVDAYRQAITQVVRAFYGELPVGPAGLRVEPRVVSSHDKDGYRMENVLFESFPGWEVNATVYVPVDLTPPFPAVVIPVGHSGKQFANYQRPAQYFARSGYVAVLFDPPGQAGEKQPGNDHFTDGVRCYLVGQSSSRYFIADALRCIDYLQTRGDVEAACGVAMTGVSGGGTTTTLAAVVDPRVRVIGPSCCLTRLADLDITQCYAGCPETHMWRRYDDGVDEVDLLCALSTRPMLLMAGEQDEVFRIDDTRALAEEVKAFYASQDSGESFELFVDSADHCYSLAQARQFTRFMNLHLLGKPERPVCERPDEDFVLDPAEDMHCKPRQDVNMFSLSLARAHELQSSRQRDAQRIRNALLDLVGEQAAGEKSSVRESEPFRVWSHQWRQVLLTAEEGIELPGTLLTVEKGQAGAILHFDDQHRNRLLERNGMLAQAAGFLAETACNIFSVDLRGWGDTAPAIYPYELAGWGGVDRYLAYTSAALGDAILTMRVRDGLAALEVLRARNEVEAENIIVTGNGLGGVVALHVATLAKGVRGVVTWDAPVSFLSLLEAQNCAWPADAFCPNALLHYDLDDLAAVFPGKAALYNPLDGQSGPLDAGAIERLNQQAGRDVYHPAVTPREMMLRIREFWME